MACFVCKGEVPEYGGIHIVDGDFVCSEKCKKEYEKRRDHFFNVVIHDDKKMEAWWLSDN